MRVNEHIGHVGRSSVSSNERWERAQEHGSVDAMSQSNTGAGYDEFTPVPLTAEALAQLASQDHGLGNVARMMDNGVWNTDGVQDDIRRESIDRDVGRYHRTLDMGERVPRNSRRSEDAQPRIRATRTSPASTRWGAASSRTWHRVTVPHPSRVGRPASP